MQFVVQKWKNIFIDMEVKSRSAHLVASIHLHEFGTPHLTGDGTMLVNVGPAEKVHPT